MSYEFKFGKYEGKNIEQVALTDYLHLKQIIKNRKEQGKHTSFDDSIEKVIKKLNNFKTPKRRSPV